MYIQLTNQVLYYEKSGQGDPILLLHGNGGSHGEFDVLTADLELDYTVYAMDSRGQGLSAKPAEFHYQDMADDVVGLIQALEIKKPAIYGFSDGVIIALLVASQHPDLVSSLMISGANLSPRGVSFFVRQHIRWLAKKTGDPLQTLMLTEPHITRADLEKISCPTLVLAGSMDLILPAETRRIAEWIPDSQLMILPRETHSSYVLHSDKLGPILRKFLNPDSF